MSNVSVELNDSEAELFKQFRQYQDSWQKIAPCLLDTTVRSVTLHLDEKGMIRKIETQQIRFHN